MLPTGLTLETSPQLNKADPSKLGAGTTEAEGGQEAVRVNGWGD